MTATLDDSWQPFYEHVQELARQGMACLGSGYLTESLAYSDRFEWYRLEPRLEFTDRDRKVGGVQLLDKSWQTHASDLFRRAVEGERLRGLTFGPPAFRPIKGDLRWWFGLLAENLTGRGLDHEWAPAREPEVEGGRLGTHWGGNDTVAVDRLDPAIADLCGRFPPGRLQIVSYPRLWAGSLPDADFAGLAWIPGGGGLGRIRSIVVRRSAVEVLLKAGVLEAGMLGPVEVVESRQAARVPILDEEFGPLPASILGKIAERNSQLVGDEPVAASSETEEVASPPAASPPGEVGECVDEGAIREAEALLGFAAPRVWRSFLSGSGMSLLGDMEVYHPLAWADEQPDHEELKALDDALPSRMLAVGSTLNGDWYSLDLDRVSADGDCPLLKFDHETQTCVDCWPSVAEVIEEWWKSP